MHCFNPLPLQPPQKASKAMLQSWQESNSSSPNIFQHQSPTEWASVRAPLFHQLHVYWKRVLLQARNKPRPFLFVSEHRPGWLGKGTGPASIPVQQGAMWIVAHIPGSPSEGAGIFSSPSGPLWFCPLRARKSVPRLWLFPFFINGGAIRTTTGLKSTLCACAFHSAGVCVECSTPHILEICCFYHQFWVGGLHLVWLK